jgi:hypothetical protein
MLGFMRRRASIALILTAAAVALPAGASAATFCVAKPGCTGAAQSGLQAAFTAARDRAGDDRIEIGPGTFAEAYSGFTYGENGDDKLEVVGAGEDKTILASPPLGGEPYGAETLWVRADDTRLAHLTVRGPDVTAASRGIILEGDRNELDHVTVADPPGSAPVLHVAVEASGDATTIRSSHLTVGGDGWRRALQGGAVWDSGATTGMRVEDSTITGATAIQAGPAPGWSLTVVRSQLTTLARADGAALITTGPARLEDSTIAIREPGGIGVQAM